MIFCASNNTSDVCSLFDLKFAKTETTFLALFLLLPRFALINDQFPLTGNIVYKFLRRNIQIGWLWHLNQGCSRSDTTIGKRPAEIYCFLDKGWCYHTIWFPLGVDRGHHLDGVLWWFYGSFVFRRRRNFDCKHSKDPSHLSCNPSIDLKTNV